MMLVFRFLMRYLKKVKDPRVITAVAVIAICLQIIRIGKRLGIDDNARIWFIIGVLVIGIIIIVVLTIRDNKKKKAAAEAERSLLMEADSLVMTSSGAQKRAAERARDELTEALDALKKSMAAQGKSGRSALRDLPWFLILGRAETGKSTMIRNSGLTIPGSDPAKRSGRRQGIGSGRNVEWWFTNHAILMEAKGRFVSMDEDAEAQVDWLGLLETLKKARPIPALNGVIVTVSIEDLIRHDSSRLDEQARLLRQRLDTAVTSLHAVCPVYLVFTKADRVHGFQEFFADLEGNARDQVCGATLSFEQIDRGEPARAFAREFEGLYRSLCKRRIPRMAGEEQIGKRGPIYLFPLEFLSLRKKLHRFVTTLFEKNPYGDSPMFRGFYFTSGNAEGESVEMVVNEVSRVIGLPPDLDASDVTRVIDSLPDYDDSAARTRAASEEDCDPRFLRELFTRIMLRDRTIAAPTERAVQRSKFQSLALQIGGLLAVAAIAVLLVTSFVRNRSLIAKTVEISREAALIPAGANDAGEVESRLRLLDSMRQWLEGLDERDDHRPVTMGFGLYRGETVNQKARGVYFDRFVDILLGPSRREFENRLLLTYPRAVEEYEAAIEDYRAYLMLVDPARADTTHVMERLNRLWASPGQVTATEGLRDMIHKHVAYAWRHAADVTYHSADLPARNSALDDRMRIYIREYWTPEYFYQAMIENVNAAVPAFSVASIPGATNLLSTDVQAFQADPDVAYVPGSYTLKGWREEISTRIANSAEQLQNDWFLKQAFEGQSVDMRDWLLDTYREDYVSAWTGFLGAVDVAPMGGISPAASRVRELAGQGSPFVRLLEAASANLRFRGDGQNPAMEGTEDAFAALHALFAVGGGEEKTSRPVDQYLSQVAGLLETVRQIHESGDAGLAATAFAKEHLGALRPGANSISQTVAFAERHGTTVAGGDPACTSAVLTLLRRPAEATWGAIIGESQAYLDAAWGLEVWERFNSTLSGRYPFLANGPDCAFEEFSRFFAPGGVFWSFYDAELKPFLDRNGTPRVVYRHGLELGPRALAGITKVQDFRDALFSETPGALGFSLRVKPGQTIRASGNAPFARTSRLTIGEERIVYDMGYSKETVVAWPGQSRSGGASIGVTMDGPNPEGAQFEGPWAFFRLLEQAQHEALGATEARVSWTLRHNDYSIQIPYDMRSTTSKSPLSPGFLRFECPRQLSPQPGESMPIDAAGAG